jgi:hypothetical protein
MQKLRLRKDNDLYSASAFVNNVQLIKCIYLFAAEDTKILVGRNDIRFGFRDYVNLIINASVEDRISNV